MSLLSKFKAHVRLGAIMADLEKRTDAYQGDGDPSVVLGPEVDAILNDVGEIFQIIGDPPLHAIRIVAFFVWCRAQACPQDEEARDSALTLFRSIAQFR
ncbi:hypothetical protein, partial [Frankia sp. Cr1]|uniref:hypothetical protein n=1 Tax=Frankia sp. Cr1 TaxID=3073931 RepID=UPI002AD1E9E6